MGIRDVIAIGLTVTLLGAPSIAAELTVSVRDSQTHEPLACRVYLTSEQGESLFVVTTSEQGSALPYAEQWVPMPHAVERHTTVSAHPFSAELVPGRYELTIERGKEYLPQTRVVNVGEEAIELTIELERWINLAERGFYSGETHVHRRFHELPNVMLAEDLNVAFPVTFWTIRSDRVPDLSPSTLRSQGPSPFGNREDRGFEPIFVDSAHVILPRNTEYEIFSINDTRHTLGAIFVLNHREVFEQTAPPIAPIAHAAHEQGALLDLDKHSWPWSMMLVPVAEIDLYELSNNSVWRTEFGFSAAPASLPDWHPIEMNSPTTFTEWGWLQYGFAIYYALLNCGFEIAPTAGTASGVHPVPLGYSRVYVEIDGEFNIDRWLDGLKQGRSFVTTGPMLFAEVNELSAGTRFKLDQPAAIQVSYEVHSERTIETVEIIVNGEVVKRIGPDGSPIEEPQVEIGNALIDVRESGWIAVRAIERLPNGRRRFAHTAPWYFTVADQPLRPVRRQVEFMVHEMEREIARNQEILDSESLAEFQQALEHYQRLLENAR